MSPQADAARVGALRRARPLLGTLVELGLCRAADDAAQASDGSCDAAFEAAFAAVLDVQRCLSRFDPDSDIARFHALRCGQSMPVRPPTRAVLEAAVQLQRASDGLFDISLCSAPQGWRCDGDALHKLDAAVRLDLGGIGKGYAVDRAVQALAGHGFTAGWVNAGGDLRAFGEVDLPVHLRDELTGGVRPFITLQGGAFATSCFDRHSRSTLVRRGRATGRHHVSVAAPLCLWADALTKLVAAGAAPIALLDRYQATAWQH